MENTFLNNKDSQTYGQPNTSSMLVRVCLRQQIQIEVVTIECLVMDSESDDEGTGAFLSREIE